MKKTQRTRINKTRRTNNQDGFVKNWIGNLRKSPRQKLIALFVLGFAALGSYLVISSMASAPRYWGNADYWMGRIRACESGQGAWQKTGYAVGTNAYGYNETDWDRYAAVQNAFEAQPKDQDAKFMADWNNPNIGSKLWEDSIDCWKPGGTIAGAPCLPIPDNPVQTKAAADQSVNTNGTETDNVNTDTDSEDDDDEDEDTETNNNGEQN